MFGYVVTPDSFSPAAVFGDLTSFSRLQQLTVKFGLVTSQAAEVFDRTNCKLVIYYGIY